MAEPINVAHARKRSLLPEVSAEVALLAYKIAYIALIVGAVFVLVGTLTLFWSDSEIKRHDNLRLSANELETARAIESAATANERASLADARAAEANAKAETERLARLQLEAKLAPRSLNEFQKLAIIEKIKAFAPQPFEFVSFQEDPEVVNLVYPLIRMLITAGWTPKPATGFLLAAFAVGVTVEYLPEKSQEFGPAASALAAALSAEGIAATAAANPELGDKWSDRIRIKVGKKP